MKNFLFGLSAFVLVSLQATAQDERTPPERSHKGDDTTMPSSQKTGEAPQALTVYTDQNQLLENLRRIHGEGPEEDRGTMKASAIENIENGDWSQLDITKALLTIAKEQNNTIFEEQMPDSLIQQANLQKAVDFFTDVLAACDRKRNREPREFCMNALPPMLEKFANVKKGFAKDPSIMAALKSSFVTTSIWHRSDFSFEILDTAATMGDPDAITKANELYNEFEHGKKGKSKKLISDANDNLWFLFQKIEEASAKSKDPNSVAAAASAKAILQTLKEPVPVVF